MQQAMKITYYLVVVDAKLGDVLRGQEDAVVADLIGVGGRRGGDDYSRRGGEGIGSHVV